MSKVHLGKGKIAEEVFDIGLSISEHFTESELSGDNFYTVLSETNGPKMGFGIFNESTSDLLLVYVDNTIIPVPPQRPAYIVANKFSVVQFSGATIDFWAFIATVEGKDENLLDHEIANCIFDPTAKYETRFGKILSATSVEHVSTPVKGQLRVVTTGTYDWEGLVVYPTIVLDENKNYWLIGEVKMPVGEEWECYVTGDLHRSYEGNGDWQLFKVAITGITNCAFNIDIFDRNIVQFDVKNLLLVEGFPPVGAE